MVSWKSLCLSLLLFFAAAPGGQFSSLPATGARTEKSKEVRLDPDFEPLLEGEKLNFAEWPANIARLLESIKGRLDTLEGNFDRLLAWGSKDTPNRRSVWWGCLKEHGFRLEHSFAYLRHRFFLAYAFHLSRANPSLEHLSDLKLRMVEYESRYIELFARLQGSLGETLIRESGLPERFPQQGNAIIGTWLRGLPTPHPDDPQIIELELHPVWKGSPRCCIGARSLPYAGKIP